MVYAREHMLGKARTAVLMPEFNLAGLTTAIRDLKCIISNGPFAIIEIESKEIISIGGSGPFIPEGHIILTGKSTADFGSWKTVDLYYGNCREQVENKVEITLEGSPLEFRITLKIHFPNADYVRLEAFSEKMDQRYCCLSNPIWNSTT